MDAPPGIAKPKRHWFRFSLRTLFAVVTVLGVWLGYQVMWIRERHKAIERLCDTGGYPPQYANAFIDYDYVSPESRAPLSLRVFGEKGVFKIDVRDNLTAKEYGPDELIALFPEAKVLKYGVEYRTAKSRLESH